MFTASKKGHSVKPMDIEHSGGQEIRGDFIRRAVLRSVLALAPNVEAMPLLSRVRTADPADWEAASPPCPVSERCHG